MTELFKIAGVVVLYNPEDNVIENIRSYHSQINYLYILDNSEIRNSYVTDQVSVLSNSEYIYNGNNLGIASALNVAATKAIGRGSDFLLTMDQDSISPNNLVSEMLLATEHYKNIGIISPFHLNKFHTAEPLNIVYEEIDHTMTSGNLLNLKAFQTIGKFCEEFFIDWVDIEYCWRLKLNGFKIIRVNTVKLIHSEGNISKQMFLFYRYAYPYNCQPVRVYYKTRNYFYLRSSYKNKLKELVKKVDIFCLKYLLKILLLERQKFRKIIMIIKGYIDYKRNITGKYFNKS